jgi:hypothetical protein
MKNLTGFKGLSGLKMESIFIPAFYLNIFYLMGTEGMNEC